MRGRFAALFRTTASASTRPRPWRTGGARDSGSWACGSGSMPSAEACRSRRPTAAARECTSPFPWRNKMAIRVLLADDHVIVCQSLKAVLEREGFQVVGEAADGREAVRLARALRPDVAALDVSMPLLNGLDAAREIQKACPRTRTILLTMHGEDTYVLQALQMGIRGYVLKSQAVTDLVRAVQEVSRGAVYLSPGVSGAVVEAYRTKKDLRDPLTPRERTVLQLVAEGKSTKEVASLLGLSVKTAEYHRNSVMRKLDIHETASLVRYAIRRGLIEP